MSYDHTQRSPLHILLFAIATLAALGALGAVIASSSTLRLVLGAVALTFVFVGLCFGSLRVRDAGEALDVGYGPLPVFGRRIPYSSMRRAERARSDWIDGWGIHWIPRRGWIYNLWGFDCVRIELEDRSVRVGSDDAEGLADFLRRRMAEREAP